MRAARRRPRIAAQSSFDDDELDNGGVDVSEEDEEDEEDELDELTDDHNSPIAHRTRSRSVSPHVQRTTRTTKQETITFSPPNTKLAPTLSDTAPPPPQPIQPAYQPSESSSSSVVFPLVTKRRLRFWIPLLVSLLLTLLLLYMRPPRNAHSPSRWSHPNFRHVPKDELAAHHRQRREAVHNPTQRTDYDQYTSHQDEKEEMAKERAKRIINEVHGVAAQIKQGERAGRRPDTAATLSSTQNSASQRKRHSTRQESAIRSSQ